MAAAELQLKEARQLVGHRELVRTMHLIRRSTSQPPQVWSADISGTVIVWDALVRHPSPFGAFCSSSSSSSGSSST
jgi:hypothetical protein